MRDHIDIIIAAAAFILVVSIIGAMVCSSEREYNETQACWGKYLEHTK